MNKSDLNDLCVCFHQRRAHVHLEDEPGSACLGCLLAAVDDLSLMEGDYSKARNYEAFHEFKMDNLAYLKKKYDERS